MNIQVKCCCCDTPFEFPIEILQQMKLPGTYCGRCFASFDFLTLRKWYLLDRLFQHVQKMDEKMTEVLARLP